jgi:acetylornithine deacetylase/succinyl-diaminopimelate desuccinylase-like protein
MAAAFQFLMLLSSCGSVVWSQTPAIDWEKQKSETLEHYRALVRIDSSASNETGVVEYLRKVLETEGVPVRVFASDPAHPNLVARLKGNGTKRPILLVAHTDTVGVQRQKWPVDPFGAVMKDGYVWGRGTTDDKDKAAAALMVMLLLKRANVKLDRDVIFLAEAGEETTSVGIDYMVREHFDQIDAEFALNEGGRTRLENGKVTAVQIATAEKVPFWIRLVANGTSGHGSIPRVDNPVVHISTAVGKLGTWQTPMRLNDTTREYFERLASISTPEKRARYNGLMDPSRAVEIQSYLAQNEPDHYSMLRTSVTPTVVKAGFQTNVIPSEAEASVDIRVLPDEDLAKFEAEIKNVIGDPTVRVEHISTGNRVPTPPSRLDSEMFRALEAVGKRVYPGSVTMPTMLTAATDCAQLRAKGVQCYGIDPPTTDENRINYGWHSDVERLAEPTLYQFVEYVWDVVNEVGATKTAAR